MLTRGKAQEWSLVYDPAANGGKGSLTVTLDKEKVTLELKAGHKAEGGRLDRFGLFSVGGGGSHVTVWFVQETWGSVSVEVTAIDGELQRGQRSRACSSITGVAPGIVAGDEWLTGPPVVRSYGACSVPVHHD